MGKKRLSSLADLKKSLPKRKKTPSPYIQELLDKGRGGKTMQEPDPEPDEVLDMEIFEKAMSGVDPLEQKGGRDVAPGPPPPRSAMTRLEEDWNKYLEQFVKGDIEFELEYTDEYMFGQTKGLDQKAWNQLKNGALSVEGHIDLHGLNSDQARDGLLFFLRESYLQGRRCVLVVSGRGLNSPGGLSVLKREIMAWLTRDPLRRVVLGFCTAPAPGRGRGRTVRAAAQDEKGARQGALGTHDPMGGRRLTGPSRPTNSPKSLIAFHFLPISGTLRVFPGT